MFRKLLLRFAMPLAVVTVLAGIAAPVAKADTSSCYWASGYYFCRVDQVTAAGKAYAFTDYNPSTGYSDVEIVNVWSGFTVIGWVDRRPYGGQTTTVWGPYTVGDGSANTTGQTDLDDRGYQVRACFKFDWASAAVHCTAWY